MPYRPPASPHWAGLVKVAGAIRTILFVSGKGSVRFVSSSAKQRPGSKADFHFFSQTVIRFLFNFHPSATFSQAAYTSDIRPFGSCGMLSLFA